MKMKFYDNYKKSYSEAGQTNPIKWQIYKKIAPGEYEATSAKFKCKDYFNDTVYTFHSGKEITVYGFNAFNGMLNKEDGNGVPVILTGIKGKFLENVEVLNKFLKSNKLPVLDYEEFDDGSVFCYIPWEYFKNTYYISALTLLQRVCNNEFEFTTIENASKQLESIGNSQDKSLLNTFIKKQFNLKGKENFVWYYSDKSNYPDKPGDAYGIPHLTHNCGLVAWGV